MQVADFTERLLWERIHDRQSDIRAFVTDHKRVSSYQAKRICAVLKIPQAWTISKVLRVSGSAINNNLTQYVSQGSTDGN